MFESGIVYSLFFKITLEFPDEVFWFLRIFAPFFTVTKKSSIPGGKGTKITVVTRAKDVRELFSQHEVVNVTYARPMVPSVGPFMLAYDTDPLCNHEKGILTSVLLQGDTPRIRQMTSYITQQNIPDGLQIETGEINVAAILGRKVAVKIVQKYFGFEAPEEMLLKWSLATQNSFFNNDNSDEEFTKRGIEAGVEMREYIRNTLIPKRKVELKEDPYKQDIVSRLLRTNLTEEAKFDEERIVSNICGLLVGSIEPMNNALCKSLDRLLEMPEAMAMAEKAVEAGDDDKLSNVCWEALRFNAPPFLKRFVSQDCKINGHRFKKGTLVLLARRSAFMDSAWIEKPRVFNPDRKPLNVSLHFGYGIHTCLGRHVAKAVVPTIMKEIISYMGSVSRVEGTRGQLGYDYKGDYVESLWVKLEPKRTGASKKSPLFIITKLGFGFVFGLLLSTIVLRIIN